MLCRLVPESLVSNDDDVSIRQFVRLLKGGGLGGGLHLGVEVKGNVCELLLDISHNFSLGSGGEGVASLRQNLH